MDECWQFWLSWATNAAIAVGTIGAVIVALFGGWIRARLFSPRLTLSLVSPLGERMPVTLTSPDGQSRQGEARYYNIRVTNQARWPKATQVRLYLIRVEQPGPDGQLQLKWAGEIPLEWKNQKIFPLERTIGPGAIGDLCNVVRDKWLTLSPIIMPNNLAEFAVHRSRVDITVSLQARSNEAESSITRFRIAWDGGWSDGDTEMQQHLVVSQVY